MWNETFVEIFAPNGQSRLVTLSQALALKQKQERTQDKALGIKRKQIPLNIILLPDIPESADFCKLSHAIMNIAKFDLAPETEAQGQWMRCVQLYYQAKSILLPNKIFNLIEDPTKSGGSVHQMLPSLALQNLLIETDAEKSFYDLLKVGESVIRSWAETQGINFPFLDFQELFIYILRKRFERDLQDPIFGLAPPLPDKKTRRLYYRRWLQFLGGLHENEKVQAEYRQALMDMGWEGYPLIALEHQKSRSREFDKLWQTFIKTHRALVRLIDSTIYWKNSIPYQTERTSRKALIEPVTTEDGYIYWKWS
ncbi:MAG TPA: hypothetical protein VK203_23495 [Nostocaceae cyanobacterium]|nr:hypothetical protein [Nostocaceae cyanobacterium]